jgi:hypothetical protein
MIKFNISAPEGLKRYFDQEITSYKIAFLKQDYLQAWRHLERAHILGQSFPVPHTIAHWNMLKFGLQLKDYKEILGQLPRLFFGGIKSFIGKIPVGNTGGAYVPILKPMAIPHDLKSILKKYKIV